MATYYVDATEGNDADAGTSAGTAWQTIAKVNATSVNPGDSVLFKRGETWRENLWVGRTAHNGTEAGGYVTFGAYGTGAKPRILGSVPLNESGDWTIHSGNVWKTTAAIDECFAWETEDVSCVILNDGVAYGNRETSLGGVDTQGDFYFDTTTGLLYLYSSSNPASYYSSIEACAKRMPIYLHGSSYVVIENLFLGHTSQHAIMSVVVNSGGLYIPNHIVIQDCDFDWIVNYDGRWGYAIQPYQSANNFIMRRNTFRRVSFACFSPQTENQAAAVSHMYFYQNTAIECRKLIEYWVTSYEGASCDDVIIAHNSAYNLGADPATNGLQENEKATGLCMFSGCVVPTNFKYVNNTSHTTSDHHLYIKGADAAKSYCEMISGAGTVIDYNCYYPDNAQTVRCGNAGGDTDTLAEWQARSAAAGYPMDVHSIVTDPKFVSTSDFNFQSDSPCIDTGTISGLPIAYNGAAPDRGPHEYGGKKCPFRKAV